MAASHNSINHYRSLFISDVHLGTKGCQSETLLDFLKHNEADTIFLVGDIVDGWKLKSNGYWPRSHDEVIKKLLRRARKGVKIVFLPGNHDEFLRAYVGMNFGGIEVTDDYIHTTADGRRFLVIHGDQYDIVAQKAKWLAFIGDSAYSFAMVLNGGLNKVRRTMGLPYWSFSAWAKAKVKNAVNFIGSFEKVLSQEAKKRQVDGVICGHIHHATIQQIGKVTYVNTGDFVESCTAIAEHEDGRLEILFWRKLIETSPQQLPAVQNHGETSAQAVA